jgi:hypothetical protein
MVTIDQLEIFFTVAKFLGWLLILGLLLWECHDVPSATDADVELRSMDRGADSDEGDTDSASFTTSPAPKEWV